MVHIYIYILPYLYAIQYFHLYTSYKLGSERKVKSRLRSVENNVTEVIMKSLTMGGTVSEMK